MSCIVGLIHKGCVYMGCDSLGSDQSLKLVRSDPKIFRVKGRHDALIGFTTSFRMGQLLQYAQLIETKAKVNHKYVVTKMIPKIIHIFDEGGYGKADEDGRVGGQFILAVNNKLFNIDNDFQVGENSCGYAAIGSGSPYALGSLYSTQDLNLTPEERIHISLKAASLFGIGVGAPFHIFSTKNLHESILDKEEKL